MEFLCGVQRGFMLDFNSRAEGWKWKQPGQKDLEGRTMAPATENTGKQEAGVAMWKTLKGRPGGVVGE